MKVYSSLTQLIGHTPLLSLNRIVAKEQLRCKLLAKIEAFNPGGSVKDRAALSMIDQAERNGVLVEGATIIEPTSGNTGVGLAWIGRLRGYRVILTMPDTMSIERRRLLSAYGAELVLTPGLEGMAGAIAKARALCNATANAVILSQFDNGDNAYAHECTTAQEIWIDTDGTIDALVAGVGTGGTLIGCARALKRHNTAITVVGVEPKGSPVLNGGESGKHAIQGIGAGFVPGIYDASLVDEVVAISDEEAYEATRMLVAEEGLLAGISSGAALSAALKFCKRAENSEKTIVVLLPDTGERYLSTGVFE